MFVQYGKAKPEFEELLTGTNFILSQLLADTTRLREELRTATRRTLSSLASADKKCTLDSTSSTVQRSPSEKSVLQSLRTEVTKTVSGSEPPCPIKDNTLANCVPRPSRHHSPPERTVVFVVPYKTSGGPEKTDQKRRAYSIWQITDLRGVFGVLLNYDSRTSHVATLGELWGVVNPRVLPNKETTSLSAFSRRYPNEKTSLGRLVITTNQVLRIGIIDGFRLCPAPSPSGGICNIPFDANCCSEDESFKPHTLCSRHRLLTSGSLSVAEKHNLEAEGVFFTTTPDGTGVSRQVISRTSELQVRTREGNQVELTRKRLRESDKPAPLPQEYVRATLRQRTRRYTERILIPHMHLNTPAEPDQCATSPVLQQINGTSMESPEGLVAFVQDFLGNGTSASKSSPITAGPFVSKTFHNIERRALHIAKRLREFPIPHQLGDTEKRDGYQELFHLVKELTLRLKTLEISEENRGQLDTATFLVKRRLGNLLSTANQTLLSAKETESATCDTTTSLHKDPVF